VLSGEIINTNFKVFGLTRSGIEPTIHRIRGDPANRYNTDVDFIAMFRSDLKTNEYHR
jgi:hypothetical protein